jgi:hypothetical protein
METIGVTMTEEADWDSPEAAARRMAQARALREQVSAGGLRFEVYLPSGLAARLHRTRHIQGSR